MPWGRLRVVTGHSAAALTTYAEALARRDWSAVRDALSDDLVVLLLHTGERFDADGFVALQRDYPGAWRFVVDEVVDGGDRAVLRSRTLIGDDTWHAATFATADPAGRLVDVVEVWTEAVAPHPDRAPG